MSLQAPVTVRAEISPGHRAEVDALLSGSSGGPLKSLGLAELPGLHFARVFVLDAVTLQAGTQVPETLVYMADADGTVRGHLRALVDASGAGVDEVFRHCRGYPADPTDEERLAWLDAHTLTPAARYVHTKGRTVERIKDESRLYACLGSLLDSGEVPPDSGSPVRLRDRLRAGARRRADFSWSREPPQGLGLVEEVRESVHLMAGLTLVIAAAPIAVPAAAVWLLLVRAAERRDTQEEEIPDQAHVDAVRQYEDIGAQNPFTAVGEIKPGIVRQVTMRVALAGLDFANRHAFARDNLAGVDSIHFARWVLLDGNRRLVFASSYDGSQESYMDDFISRLAWGINLVFSNGTGFPKTRWLVLGGARDEIAYKHYLRRHQVPTPVYFSAYPRHTARNLDSFTRVHAGIATDGDEQATRRWLSLL